MSRTEPQSHDWCPEKCLAPPARKVCHDRKTRGVLLHLTPHNRYDIPDPAYDTLRVQASNPVREGALRVGRWPFSHHSPGCSSSSVASRASDHAHARHTASSRWYLPSPTFPCLQLLGFFSQDPASTTHASRSSSKGMWRNSSICFHQAFGQSPQSLGHACDTHRSKGLVGSLLEVLVSNAEHRDLHVAPVLPVLGPGIEQIRSLLYHLW